MKIFRGAPPPANRLPTALTIGNFDGVHRGHQALLAQVVTAARALGLVPAVMTFEPHPRELFAPQAAPARIATLRDTISSLAACGIERVFVQHFSHRFAALTAQRFIEEILVHGCRAQWLAVGDDFRFGARRAGDITLLRAAAATAGFEVAQLDAVVEDGQRISSSLVRAALAAGDLGRVRHLLGRPYVISGRVLHGAKLGRTIGFPTLNLRMAQARQPRRPAAHGIFAVRVHGLAPQALPGVASLGLRPTVDDSGRWLLEVHVFDFDRSVYGQLVRVELVDKLRDEEKYASVELLREAISADAQRARKLLQDAALTQGEKS
jgi:riboflavin kinase/FMN adenylyltransferase